MSEPNLDLIAVACVLESSLLLASEWSRIMTEYVQPLLRRLAELHPSHQSRLAFVVYGAADTRPHPILCKKFFAPVPDLTRLLREEPSSLGIGQTNSGSGRGLSALEGLVAAIEFFDMLMMASTNFPANHGQTQSPQKENRSLIFHLLHVAASPPDSAQKPHHNAMQHLDSVNWDSIPTELRKRKINLSLIGLRKIPQFQDLQSLVAGPGVQSPWFNVHAPHVLLLSGFPTPQTPQKSGVHISNPDCITPSYSTKGTKRQADVLTSDQSPDAKRQKLAADPITKTSSASPALSSARTPQYQRAQHPVQPASSLPPSTVASGQNSSPAAQPIQTISSVPAPAPAPVTASPSVPPLPSGPSVIPHDREILEQVVAPTKFTFGQMMDRLKVLEREVTNLDTCIANAQNTGQTDTVDSLQKDRAAKARVKEQIKLLLKDHYQKVLSAKELQKASAGPPQETGVPPVTANNQLFQASNSSTWHGSFSGSFYGFGSQAKYDTHAHILGMLNPPTQNDLHLDIRTETWPKDFVLHSCKEPLKDGAELSSWLKHHQHQSRIVRFKPNPHAPDVPLNEQRFLALYKFMSDNRIYAYAGWQLPSGRFSYNIIIFPMQNGFIGAVFPEGMPDLPGCGNTFDVQPSVGETRPQMSSAPPFPPALLARMQALDPVKQKQLLQYIRIQQEQQRRQQQPQPPAQALNSLAMSIPSNQYGAVVNVPAGLRANVNVPPTNASAYNTGGGTVNYEMLQSFMHRSAEGSTSQGMNLGSMS